MFDVVIFCVFNIPPKSFTRKSAEITQNNRFYMEVGLP